MAAAGDGQLEAVDVESLLVRVRQQADEVVLLQAAGVEVPVDERARSSRVHALLQPLGLQSNVHLVLPNHYHLKAFMIKDGKVHVLLQKNQTCV